MNKQRHPNLPSISTLLTRTPPSPPPIIVINEEQEQEGYSTSYHRLPSSSTLSPMLSPIDSYASSAAASPNNQPLSPLPSPSMLSLPKQSTLPPLQGDDPPRRLRHPSVSSIGSISPKPSYNSLWSVGSPNHSSPMEFSPSPQSSYCSSPPISREERSVSPLDERPPLPPSTQIVLNESGQPVLKRRRGRPPSMREPALEGGWTFLTPTVWDVKNNTQSTEAQPNTTLVQQEQKKQQQLQQANTDSIMNGSMAAFTSSNMDMVLQMPRKKRGRKPKTHIVGNSCFVWKDIAASRRSTKAQKQQQSEEKSSLRRLEQAPI
jgi:hypothetical protein